MAKNMNFAYKKKSFEERRSEFERLKSKHPETIPVVLQKMSGSSAPVLKNGNLLVPKALSVSQLAFIVMEKIDIGSDQSLFLFANDTLLSNGCSMEQIYQEHQDDDGFLYISYALMAAFGYFHV